ncbi:MAG: hypothetical protein HDR24_00450 [Lachnospiraceae bacterium]|nr:hypothetical protein [Lachnospiraceae bacterium]
MAIFSKLVTTQNGRALIARMLSGEEKITFTKVRSSDTAYALEELENLEELAGIRQTSSISKVSRTNTVSVKVETVFTNTKLTEGYNMRTVALYAQDGDGEVLYAAAVETSGNCFIPAFGGTTVSGAYIQLVTTVSNAENVTLEVDNSVFATIGNIRDIQEQIDFVSELIEGMAAGINTNAEKLELLEKIGGSKYHFEIRKTLQSTFGGNEIIEQIKKESLVNMDSITYYLYVLSGNIKFNGLGGNTDIYEGVVYITINVGSNGSSIQCLPISRGQAGTYITSPVSIVVAAGPPSGSGINVRAQPFIYKQDANRVPVDVEETFSMSASDMVLDIYKLGGILSTVQGTGTVDGSGVGVTDNYNYLKNKPSINDVVLQGNLTTKQLGIEVGSGNSEEMTYEEALEILNEEEEAAE